ncbi:MAG: TGF-beta receptor type extracellular region [Lacunisphaera sp.]|nr:TGF-beta receptor type extracellular region [Lacunisphaera sp.]
MPHQPYLTAPQKLTTMPPGIPYIIGNEAAERFNFYGMRAILVVFMTKYLMDRSGQLAPMNENEANGWYHLFLSANYFFPMIGAVVSDAFFGKYRTIFWLSLVYCAGSVVLALDHTRLGLTLGLTLIAIGSGGIKPCVSSHVGDQFGTDNQHLLSRAFGWFYFSVNFGSFFSILLIPWLLEHYGPMPAFGVPAVLMLLAAFVFWLGRFKFAHIPPTGKTFLRDTFCREGMLTLGRIAIIYAFVAIFWSLWDQSGGEWVTQAEKMDLQFAGIQWLSSQIQALNAIMILAFIPLFQYLIYPAISKVYPLTPLRKIGLGLIVTGLSFFVSAWIETQIAAGLRPSIGWQIPAYALLSAGEVMVSITGLEFAYTQAPKHMKAMVQALYLLAVSAGNFFTAVVHWFIANPDGSVKLHGAAYYDFFAWLSIGCVAVFVFVARAYKEKSYLQGGPTAYEIEVESTETP